MSQQPNKPINNTNTSPLKGLVGFLSGLVLATLVIIAVLLMINSNSKRDFKNTPELVSNKTPNTQTETLVPNTQNHASQLEHLPETDDQSASQVIARANMVDEHANMAANNQKPTIIEGNPTTPQANADTRFNEPNFEEEQPISKSVNQTVAQETEPAIIKQPARNTKQPESVVKSKPQPKRETPATTQKADTKPTPQQILDSGNIEKARELAKQQAKQDKKSSVVLQAGSFNSRDYAESQRAKLALLGVQTQITTANVNGKTVYRVQTPKMSGEQANMAKDVMKRNGVGVYERHAN